MAYTRQTFRINDTELIYTHSIYISPSGNDTAGDGSKNKPYKTIQFASNKVINDTTAVILLPGTYNEDPYLNSTLNTNSAIYVTNGTTDQRLCSPGITKAVFTSINYQMNFIGYDNNTIINTKFISPGCAVIASGKNKPIYMYNIAINVDCLNGNTTDSNVFIAGDAESKNIYVYNCVFKYVSTFINRRGVFLGGPISGSYYAYNCTFDMGDVANAVIGNRHSSIMHNFMANNYYYNYWSPSFSPIIDYADPAITTPLNVINCIFINIQDWTSVASNAANSGCYINAINCIYPNIIGSYGNLTATNCIKDDVKIDLDCFPVQTNAWRNTGIITIKDIDTNKSSIGTYGGPYSWNKIVSEVATIKIEDFQKVINKNEDDTYDFTINPPNSSSIVKMQEAFSGNFIDHSNILYSYPIDQRSWNKIQRIEIL